MVSTWRIRRAVAGEPLAEEETVTEELRCAACGEFEVDREGDFCEACEECWCSGCNRVQRARTELHKTRDSLDEPLPCGLCHLNCCNCEFDLPQTLGDA